MAKKEDMKEILKQDEVQERMRNRAFELFLKGISDEEIQKELIVIVPGVSIKEIQQLHRQWEDKTAADKEMIGGEKESIGGEENARLGEIPSSEQKIEPSVPGVESPFIEKRLEEREEYPPHADKTEYGKENPLPSQKDFVDYLRPKTKGYEEILDKVFSKTRWRHWIRYDEGGFAFPSVEDWVELKKVLNLNDTFDLSETEEIGVFDEPKPTEESIEEKIIERETEEKGTSYEKEAADLEKERRELESMKADIRDDQTHVEIVRATEELRQAHDENVRTKEELRRAITNEIHARESYEDAKREMKSAKDEMIRVRSELDKFRESVDVLKLEERLQKRETVEEADLESETAEGKRFEERISSIGLEKTIEDIVNKSIQKRDVEEKPEEPKKTVELDKEKMEEKIPETIEARNGRIDDMLQAFVKDLYKKNLLSIEELAGYLNIGVEEARKLDIKRDEEVLQSVDGEKPAEEITSPSTDDALAKIAELSDTSVDDVRRWIAEKHKHPKIEEVEVIEGKPPDGKLDEKTASQKFYNKVKRYLDIHPYLVVKKEMGVPEVYYMRMKREGILLGLGGGVPAGCLLLYIILLLAGAL